MIGFTTVRVGDRVAVWNRRGEMRVVDGPRRLWLFRETVQRLERYRALAGEYVAVTYRDGRVENRPGPEAVWFDPVEHAAITVEPAVAIDSDEAIVVYARDIDQIRRRVLRGPAQYVPAAGEWLNEFSWHGADPKHPARKVPHALRFTKLRVIPDQMYHDVEEVRTADDALVTVKLMVFFELVDVEPMLDRTHDPIADMINAVSADVIDFAGSRPFETFKAEAERLNDLAAFPQLASRTERIGYRVTKVVYRGYHASAALQAMHDHAIEARTRLKLEAETENQAQEVADFKLARELERGQQRHRMESDETAHQNALKRLAHAEQLEQRRLDDDAALGAARRAAEQELAQRQAGDRQRLQHLEGMRGLGVDLTRWLVAQYQQPDRLIRIDSPGTRPQVQVTDN